MEITAETRRELEAAHGRVLVLSFECEDGEYVDAAFRVAKPEEWQRFIDEVTDTELRPRSLRHLVFACCVAPERQEFEQMVKQWPGIVQSFGNELTDFCGMRRAQVRKK